MQKKLLFLVLCIGLSGSVFAMNKYKKGSEIGQGLREEESWDDEENSSDSEDEVKKVVKSSKDFKKRSERDENKGSVLSSLLLSTKLQFLARKGKSLLKGGFNYGWLGLVALLPFVARRINKSKTKPSNSMYGLFGLGCVGLGILGQRLGNAHELQKMSDELPLLPNVFKTSDKQFFGGMGDLDVREDFLGGTWTYKAGGVAALIAVLAVAKRALTDK